jgi:DNA-binding NtrC family response regulator
MKRKQVLIVDGDSEFAQVLAAALREHGVGVEIGTDVQIGLAIFREQQPELVVTSLQLPGGGGVRLHEMIRRWSTDTPVLYVCESGAEPAADRARELGAIDLVERGRGVNDLVEIIGQSLTDTAPAEHVATRRTWRALVIEDERDHCEMIEDCFARASDTPVLLVFVRTVEQACDMLTWERFDFILLDHSLPDGTGCDVLDRMREHLLTTPVIGLSTSADPEVALADFRGGAIEFIEKHAAFRGDELPRRVFTVLRKHRQQVAANAIEQLRRSWEMADGVSDPVVPEGPVERAEQTD